MEEIIVNVIVLCGGNSTERDVSINSGFMVCKALRSIGHNAVMLDVYFGTDKTNILDNKEYNPEDDKKAMLLNSEKVAEEEKSRQSYFGKNVIENCQLSDIVFMALHGANGEDGKCQAAFDLLGVKYTGADQFSSALAMDKAITKQIFLSQNIATPKGVWIKKGNSTKLEDYGMKVPVVVKACNGGSSVGVVIVTSDNRYEAAVEECYSLEDNIIVEEYVKGREFSVGVIEGKALPVVEIIPKTGWYDYKNKYLPGATEDVCPAELSKEVTEKMQALAEDACKALRFNTYCRADVLMDEDENMYCIEVNSLPGMTPTSLLPMEAKAAGMEFPQLCEHLINVSMKKYDK